MTDSSEEDGSTAVPRPRGRRALDALIARVLKMPPGRLDYTLRRGVPVAMRDGIRLLTDVYAPVGKSLGTVLIRTPYGRTGPIAMLTAGYYATHGYHVVNQSCRGTFGSGGELRPFVAEIDDGADTVAWLRGQSWFGGRLALCGASYLGYTAWAIMTDPPPELTCAVIAIAAHDNHRVTYRGGAFALEPMLGLLDGMDHLEDGFVKGLSRFPMATRRLRRGFEELPLLRAEQTVLAGSRMPYREWLTATDAEDPVWRAQRLGRALERVEIPVLLHGGWQDPFVDQMIDQYATLRQRGVDVALTIGPWTHLQLATQAAAVTMAETLDWLDEHLAGTGRRRRASPVRIFVSGAEQWRDLPDWPPDSDLHLLCLQPNQQLAENPPPAAAAASTFRYDPADPTPSVGGQVINPALAGRRDNRKLEERADVLTFTTAPLQAPLEIIGNPMVELVHRTDNPHADLFVRLCEVETGGRSVNLGDAFQRLDPDQSSGTVSLRLDPIAHRFSAGSRIRLQVSGGAHPRFARELGTNGDPATSTTLATSQRKICHGAGGQSRISLPCTPGPSQTSPPERTLA